MRLIRERYLEQIRPYYEADLIMEKAYLLHPVKRYNLAGKAALQLHG